MSVIDINKYNYITIDGVSILRSDLRSLPDLPRFYRWKDFSLRINHFVMENPAEAPLFMEGLSKEERGEVIETLHDIAEIKRRFGHLFAMAQ